MPYSNKELVEDFISYKLSQKNFSCNQYFGDSRTATPGTSTPENEQDVLHVNGSVSGTENGGSSSADHSPDGIRAVKEALHDSGDEFELRYRAAFSDLSSQLHITPVTAYQSFEQVINELFRDGVNWGRIVALFAFGGALCVECVEKEMGSLVKRIAEWMTTYLDNNLDPWIQRQGGWDTFAKIYGSNAAAECRRSQERFSRWLLAGMTLATGLMLGSYFFHKRL
ncbi:bcl-2-like protein 1 [Erpetoichthys calabaricus]|uniref:Bcl-2-like protein 1 n=1 Tax=Erpetoichthys calabaricus TaxID=27687 RepID=A0A8C4STP1_ERPCA|nr:bcl-2-like protein 1 [Erpetoichthys calabaricus]XP_028667956.1 bcl-2-like protein 1 [Erpetoichthys calabaricus]XP_028667958.1 bcl-2-like protein 1 [Erpetoichthys calabaricus]